MSPFRNILVAVDGSPPAERALDDAIELARATGASLTLSTVAPELSGWFPDGAQTSTVLLKGRVGEAIVRRIRAAGHDLLAMGSRRRGELLSMVLGSLSHEVLHDPPVPVLIVPPIRMSMESDGGHGDA
ncbi:MAG: universal stress protein [Solirubrobacteraceae bacterium]